MNNTSIRYQQGMQPTTAQNYWKNRRSLLVSRVQLGDQVLIRFADGAVVIKESSGQVRSGLLGNLNGI